MCVPSRGRTIGVMAKEKVIDESPDGGAGPPSGSGSGTDDDVHLPSLSCSDLNDLFNLVRSQILVEIGRQESTPKWRVVRQRSSQLTIDALWALANGIQIEFADRPCPGSLT
jgi:hypothetical protein